MVATESLASVPLLTGASPPPVRVVAMVVLASAGLLEICGIPANKVSGGIMPRPVHTTSKPVKVGEGPPCPSPLAHAPARQEEWVSCVDITGDTRLLETTIADPPLRRQQ